jgi:hypothetical protein
MTTLPDVLRGIEIRWRQLDAAAELPCLSMLSDRQVLFLLGLRHQYGEHWRPSSLSDVDLRELYAILTEQEARRERKN